MLSRRRFDVDEYHRMARAGILTEDDRVELLDGEIVRIHAIGGRHMACVIGLNHRLVAALSDRALISIQNPVRLDRYSEPEPDVAVLRRRADLYAEGPPSPADALLLVEVADSSLSVDRRTKLPLYAAAGIREVWIVDLTTDAVEVYRRPAGNEYGSCRRLTQGTVVPESFPDLELAVGDILPPSA